MLHQHSSEGWVDATHISRKPRFGRHFFFFFFFFFFFRKPDSRWQHTKPSTRWLPFNIHQTSRAESRYNLKPLLLKAHRHHITSVSVQGSNKWSRSPFEVSHANLGRQMAEFYRPPGEPGHLTFFTRGRFNRRQAPPAASGFYLPSGDFLIFPSTCHVTHIA